MPITARALTTLLATTTTFALAATSPAQGATIALDGSALRYTAAPGEANSPYFNVDSSDPGHLLVIENGTTFTGLPDACVQVTAQMLSCAVTALSGVDVDLGDGDDAASFASELPAVPVTVTGGDGADRLFGPEHDGAILNGRISRLVFDAWQPKEGTAAG